MNYLKNGNIDVIKNGNIDVIKNGNIDVIKNGNYFNIFENNIIYNIFSLLDIKDRSFLKLIYNNKNIRDIFKKYKHSGVIKIRYKYYKKIKEYPTIKFYCHLQYKDVGINILLNKILENLEDIYFLKIDKCFNFYSYNKSNKIIQSNFSKLGNIEGLDLSYTKIYLNTSNILIKYKNYGLIDLIKKNKLVYLNMNYIKYTINSKLKKYIKYNIRYFVCNHMSAQNNIDENSTDDEYSISEDEY